MEEEIRGNFSIPSNPAKQSIECLSLLSMTSWPRPWITPREFHLFGVWARMHLYVLYIGVMGYRCAYLLSASPLRHCLLLWQQQQKTRYSAWMLKSRNNNFYENVCALPKPPVAIFTTKYLFWSPSRYPVLMQAVRWFLFVGMRQVVTAISANFLNKTV